MQPSWAVAIAMTTTIVAAAAIAFAAAITATIDPASAVPIATASTNVSAAVIIVVVVEVVWRCRSTPDCTNKVPRHHKVLTRSRKDVDRGGANDGASAPLVLAPCSLDNEEAP